MLHLKLADFVCILPAILFGFTIHEFSHAFAAVRLGDNTPRELGRYTLNPLSHIDPIGFLLVLFAGFGWAKPVVYNPSRLRSPKTHPILVSLAGPLANLLAAVLFTILLKLTYQPGQLISGSININLFLWYFISINMMLAVFNLLPIPPLDGAQILLHLLPDSLHKFKVQFVRYGSIVIIVVFLLGYVTGASPIGMLVNKATYGLLKVFRVA